MQLINICGIVFCCLISGYNAIDDRIHFRDDESNAGVRAPITIAKKEVKREADGYCTFEEKKKKLVTVSVPYTETETYYGRCRGYYFKKCLNERQVVKTRQEQHIQEYTETVRSCCEGYAESADSKCIPVCQPLCDYGVCSLPNVCTCYDGYTPKLDQPNKCVATCPGCTHGTCVAPNVCQCNAGYIWDLEKIECTPFCSGNCHNGKCVAPEKCECDHGFDHHPTHSICIPHCDDACVHGQCIATNKCECDFGFQFVNASHSVCEPFCELSCKNAKCVEPNVCECHDGYTVLDGNKPHECHCGLYCVEIDGFCHCLDEAQRVSAERIRHNISSICTDSNCRNGVCLTPDDCECYDGFEKDESLECVAVNETCIDDPANCNGTDSHGCNCINGICAANQTCVCVNGFKMSEGHNDLCEPRCTKECVNGFCINPDSCECDNGYRLGYNESESHICHPICDPDAEDNNGCSNGTCVAPDTCQCHEGYQLDLAFNFTCIPSPHSASIRKSGMHWMFSGGIPLLIFVASLATAAYLIHRRRNKSFKPPKLDDEANEPIAPYLNEEM